MVLLFSVLTSTGVLFGTLISLILLYWFNLRRNHYWKSKPIKSDQPIPFIGSMGSVLRGKAAHQIDEALYLKYGRLFGAYGGLAPTIYISDPDLLKLILVKDFSAFADRRQFITDNPYFDNNLMALKGDHWKRVRNIVTPTFTTGKIKGMMPGIVKCVEKTIQNTEKLAEKGSFDLKKLLSHMTLDVIANVAFGTEIDSQNDPDNPFVTQARKVFNVDVNYGLLLAFFAPRLGKLLRISLINAEVSDFFRDLTFTIINERRRSKEKRNDFLQLLLDCLNEPEEVSNEGNDKDSKIPKNRDENTHSKALTEVELVAQCIIFFLAGFDTTATTISVALYYLALNKDVQKKALEEVDRIHLTSSPIEAAIAGECRYLDAVISETLRMHPPLGRLERLTIQDYVLADTGIVIPKGMIVTIPIYSIQRDPEFFPEPDRFMPERFLPQSSYDIKSFTYMPFGDGPRNCIAKRFALVEVKLCLLMMLRKFEFTTCEETKVPLDLYTGGGLMQPRSVFLRANKRDV